MKLKKITQLNKVKMVIIIIFALVVSLQCRDKNMELQNPGQFIKADINSVEIQKAYKFATANLKSQNIKVLKLIEARSQVVAGFNILLVCEYKVQNKIKTLSALVHESPDGRHTMGKVIKDLP